jgi:two-component system, NtrC family, nitrogen regulation response regulator GlnG
MPDGAIAPILIVEDDEPLAALVARHLIAHGLPAEVVTSAEEAERRLRIGPRPSLLLLDINLPGETGWSLLRRPAYAAAGRPQVIVVTATRISGARLREFGIAGYLPKPFAMETLLETVRRHVADVATGGADGLQEPMDVEIP